MSYLNFSSSVAESDVIALFLMRRGVVGALLIDSLFSLGGGCQRPYFVFMCSEREIGCVFSVVSLVISFVLLEVSVVVVVVVVVVSVVVSVVFGSIVVVIVVVEVVVVVVGFGSSTFGWS